MPRIELQEAGTFPDFQALFKAFPRLSARILGYIGKQAAVTLADMMVRGERGITFRNMNANRRGPGGRRMITYSVGRGAKWVAVSSFPLNFFEGGRRLRSGKREAPRKILRGTLRQTMSARMSSAVEGAQNLIVDDWFNDSKKGGTRRL